MAKFVSEIKSQTEGDYYVKIIKRFNYKSLGYFFDLDHLKTKFEEIKKQGSEIYKINNEIIDQFLENFDQKDNRDFN